MSLILRSNTTPGQATARLAAATGLRDGPAQFQPLTFDEVLSRSLATGVDPAEKVTLKAVPPGPAPVQDSDDKADPAELLNAISMAPMALDSGSAATTAGEFLRAGHEDLATAITGSWPAGPGTVASDAEPGASAARQLGLRLDSAITASIPGLANTLPPAAGVPPTRLSVSQRALTEAALPAAELTPEAQTSAAPRPAPKADGQRLAAGAKKDHRTTLQARPDAVGGQPVLVLDAARISGQAIVPSSGGAGQPSGDDDRTSSNAQPVLAMNTRSTAAGANAASILSTAGRGGAAEPAADTAPVPGTTRESGLQVDPAITTSIPGLANTLPPAAGVPPTRLSVSPRLLTEAALPAPELTPEALASAAPRPAPKADGQRLAAGPKKDDQTTLRATSDAVGGQPVPVLDAASIAAQAIVPGSGAAGQPSGDDDTISSNPQPALALNTRSTAAGANPAWIASAASRGGPAALAPDAAPVPGATREPGLQVDPARPAFSPGLANTLAPAASVPSTALKADRQRLPNGQKILDQTALQTRPDAVSAGPTHLPDARSSAAQTSAPDGGTADSGNFRTDSSLLLSPVAVAAADPAGVAGSNNAGGVLATSLLSPEVGSKEWGQALGQQMVRLSKADHQVTELQLNPPGLGPLKVTLHMNEHQMQVVFVSAHASVRAAVEAAVPQLRANLADSGISLGHTSVSSESQAQTAFTHQHNDAPRHQAYRSNSLPEATARTVRALGAARRPSDAGVDTYA